MGGSIISAIAGPVLGRVLGGGTDNSGKAQAAETARLNAESEAASAEAEKKRKAQAAQRTQTDIILGGAQDQTSGGVGNLGG